MTNAAGILAQSASKPFQFFHSSAPSTTSVANPNKAAKNREIRKRFWADLKLKSL